MVFFIYLFICRRIFQYKAWSRGLCSLCLRRHRTLELHSNGPSAVSWILFLVQVYYFEDFRSFYFTSVWCQYILFFHWNYYLHNAFLAGERKPNHHPRQESWVILPTFGQNLQNTEFLLFYIEPNLLPYVLPRSDKYRLFFKATFVWMVMPHSIRRLPDCWNILTGLHLCQTGQQLAI